jgi:uncharacterized protein YndB with AHSA1/START domain
MGAVLFWVLIVLGVLIGLIVLVAIIGSFLPRGHVVARGVTTSQPPETVWQAITDIPAVPTWNAMVKKVERMPDRNGHEVWRETYQGNFPLQLETVEAIEPRRLVRAIADEKGPFTGRWEFDITPLASGCKVTITERGEIGNPAARFFARLFMNPAMYLEKYLQALAGKLGDPVKIEQPGMPVAD